MRILKVDPGVVSKRSVWVLVTKNYLYRGATLVSLLKQVFLEFKHKQHHRHTGDRYGSWI
jgi:hypothetical protein